MANDLNLLLKNKNKNKSRVECFCALCRSPRVIRYSRRLQGRHFIQILTLGIVFIFATYRWFDLKGIYAFPLIWASYELIHKLLYRKDLKCPYCGFDPTWYKKDIKLARRKVEEFLKENPSSPVWSYAKKHQDDSQSIQ